MAIQFAPSGACAFDADTRSKRFEVCNVRFTPVPTFVWGLVSGGVDKPIVEIHGVQKGSRPEPIVEIHGVQKGSRPELSGKAGAIE